MFKNCCWERARDQVTQEKGQEKTVRKKRELKKDREKTKERKEIAKEKRQRKSERKRELGFVWFPSNVFTHFALVRTYAHLYSRTPRRALLASQRCCIAPKTVTTMLYRTQGYHNTMFPSRSRIVAEKEREIKWQKRKSKKRPREKKREKERPREKGEKGNSEGKETEKERNKERAWFCLISIKCFHIFCTRS